MIDTIQRAFGIAIAVTFGLFVFAFLLFAVGETIDTVAQYRVEQSSGR